MTATSQQGSQTIAYEADANGLVKRNAAGIWYEEIGWSNLIWNREAATLSPAMLEFREPLSLAAGYRLSVPNLSQVDPRLIGPITDLLTFYADLQLEMQQTGLSRAGDHVYFKHGTPSSWADGNYVMTGEDSIDFDITLTEVNAAEHTATIVVRHVPPAKPQVKLVASWMQTPVADTPNNWVMVSKGQPGKFIAQVGKETFDVRLQVDSTNGRILSASMDNPVKVLERECSDAALTTCGDPVRFELRRQIAMQAAPRK